MPIEIKHIGKEKKVFPCVAYLKGTDPSKGEKITVFFTTPTSGIVLEIIGNWGDKHVYEYVTNLRPIDEWTILEHARIVIKT